MNISKGIRGLSGDKITYIREVIAFTLGTCKCEFNSKNIDIILFELGNTYTMDEIIAMDGDDLLEKTMVFVNPVNN